MLVVEARRPNGAHVTLRFRGVSNSEATSTPAPGSPLKLGGIGSTEGFSLAGFFFPFLRRATPGYARVRIDAGDARLEIVCQDAEWWEEPGVPGGR